MFTPVVRGHEDRGHDQHDQTYHCAFYRFSHGSLHRSHLHLKILGDPREEQRGAEHSAEKRKSAWTPRLSSDRNKYAVTQITIRTRTAARPCLSNENNDWESDYGQTSDRRRAARRTVRLRRGAATAGLRVRAGLLLSGLLLWTVGQRGRRRWLLLAWRLAPLTPICVTKCKSGAAPWSHGAAPLFNPSADRCLAERLRRKPHASR